MSLFRRSLETRAVTSLDWVQGNDLPGNSGALSLVPVFAACRLISDSIATLPLQAYRKTSDGRQSIPLPQVFDKETRIEWVQQALMSLLVNGNAYGLQVGAEVDALIPKSVVWLNPDEVTVDEHAPIPVFYWRGKEVERTKLKHIPAYSVPGQIKGVSPIGACSMLSETATATQRMMRDWFKGRAVPGVTMQNTEKTLDPEAAEVLGQRLSARLRNGKPFVHGKDWNITVMSMPADDAGFIESAKLNATQIASIYGIPAHMIGGDSGGSLTYSTVELNQIQFLTNTLRPWLAKLEQEFSSWLPRPQFVKFNVDALLRVDTKTRYDVHRIKREIGTNNVDEIRVLEDEMPLPDGQGQDYTPLARMGATAPKETR